MNRDALEAHARLATLPRRAVVRDPEPAGPSSLVGYPIEGRRPGRAASAASPLRVTRPTKARPNPPPSPPPRKPRVSIPSSRPNRWGFGRGDAVVIVGGRLVGSRGIYVGATNSDRAYVVVEGIRRSVVAKHLRRAPR